MKKQRKLKKGLAILLTAAMVVGLLPDVGTLQVSAEETSTTSGVTFSALDGAPEGYSGETYSNLLDGTATTKWCCSFEGGSAYVIFKASQPIYVNGYSVWTANDSGDGNGARNPVAWTLSACNDYDETNKTGGTWQIIHEVEVTEDNPEDALPAANETEKKYSFQTTEKYQYFKLNITSIVDGNTMQLGDFALTYDACEHQWVKTKTTIAPTCTEGGYDVEKCSLCQATRNVANGTSAKGHEWENGDVVDPTCTEHGYTPQTCSVCGAKQETDIKDALGHDFGENGICSRCSISNTEPYQPAGDGTESSPYKISTVGELYWFAALVNGDTTVSGVTAANKAACAELMNDITVNTGVLDASGQPNGSGDDFTKWTPIGKYYKDAYVGIFDGQGHTIRGLWNYWSVDNIGLFGNNKGTIKNVGVVDSYLNGHENIGGVCGNNYGSISNCYFTGSIDGYNNNNIGGVCGSNDYDGSLTNCYNTGKVSGNQYVGGVCGNNYGSISNCYYLSYADDNNGGKTSDQFRSGEVAYLLNGKKSEVAEGEEPLAWYQNIDDGTADTYPVLDSTHGTVYQCTPCTAVYSNTSKKTAEHSYKMEDDTNHKCENCGDTQVHNVAYAVVAGNSSIKVKCGDDCGKEYGIVTLSAPTGALTYDGSAKAATADTSGVTGVTISNPTITYKQGGNTLPSAPTNAGTYTASITLGDGDGAATVSVEYTIAKADTTETANCEMVLNFDEAANTYSATIAKVEGAEYKFGDSGKWSTENTLTGIAHGTEVTGYIRIAAISDNYNPGTESSKTLTSGHGTLTHVEAKEPDCVNYGNLEYWYCESCGKYFSDAEGTKETTKEAVTIAATDHSWNKVTYEINATHHWYNCQNENCPITDNSHKEGFGEHIDSNNDNHCDTCGNQIAFIVTGRILGIEGNTIEGNMTGLDTYKLKEEVTLTVPVIAGYNFVGWYTYNSESPYYTGEILCKSRTYEFNAVADRDLVAVYKPIGSAELTIDGGKDFTINGDNKTTAITSTYPMGSQITVVCNDSDFGYWKNSAGMVLSRDKSYAFTVTGKETISAVFNTKLENKATVVFESYYGQVIARDQYAEGSTLAETPGLPFRYGYTALGWDYNGDGTYSASEDTFAKALERGFDSEDKLVKILPVYQLNETTYRITVENGTGAGNYRQNEVVTVVANAASEGNKFSHWADGDGNILSYNEKYQFYAAKSITVTAVYVEDTEKVEAKGTTEIVDKYADKANGKLIFVSMSTVPEGCTIDKAGIIATNVESVGTSGDGFNADTAVYVRGNAWTGNAYRFTWYKSNVGSGENWYVRAYLVYTDAEGNVNTVYGDMVSLTMPE